MVNGDPEYALTSAFTCQPPAIAAARPPLFSSGLPSPNGNSATTETCRLCGRSFGRSASFRLKYCIACTCGAPSLSVSQQMPNDLEYVYAIAAWTPCDM